MKSKLKAMHYLILCVPVFLATVLICVNFNTDTEKMLSIFLSFIWGEMVALGGGLIFLKKFDFSTQRREVRILEDLNDNTMQLALILIVQTLIFLAVSAIYPAKNLIHSFIINQGFSETFWSLLTNIYDSTLFALIICPSVCSVLIGMWCLYLSLNEKKEKGTAA